MLQDDGGAVSRIKSLEPVSPDSLRVLTMNVTFLLLSKLPEIALVLILLLQYMLGDWSWKEWVELWKPLVSAKALILTSEWQFAKHYPILLTLQILLSFSPFFFFSYFFFLQVDLDWVTQSHSANWQHSLVYRGIYRYTPICAWVKSHTSIFALV